MLLRAGNFLASSGKPRIGLPPHIPAVSFTFNSNWYDMTLQTLLAEHREAVINDWIDAVHGTYAIDTVGFLRSKKNQFTNPVGHKTREAIPVLVDFLLGKDCSADSLTQALDEIVRVRAVQNFPADKGMAVLFLVKNIVRKHLGKHAAEQQLADELFALDAQVDALVLKGFAIYTECCLKVERMRVDEFKRKHHQLIRRAERILETPEGEPEQ